MFLLSMLQIYETFVTKAIVYALKCVNVRVFNILRMFRRNIPIVKRRKFMIG